MSYLSSFLIFSTFVAIGSGQQLMSLSYFKGNNVQNMLKVETPFSIYVSAHSDDDSVLKNVFIVSGAEKLSLYDFENRKMDQNFGQLKPYVVWNSAYLTTQLDSSELEKLTGVIYLSSPDQVKDNNFYVFDVNLDQNLKLDGLGTIDLTILFLNTNMAVGPASSTLISNWSQNPKSLAYIYAGFPINSIEPKNTQIFSNPMMSDHFNQYFPSVEKFSISLVAFYMKTFNGAPSFRIEPGYDNLAGTSTTAFTTTGFFMKPKGLLDAATQVNIMKDPTHAGSTGVNILGHLPDGATVSFDVYDGSEHYNQLTVPDDFFDPWSTPHIGNNFVISSTCARDGVYYLQYFVVQGPVINGTTGLPRSQTTVMTTPKYPDTTTKGSDNALPRLLSMMILLIFVGNI